MILILKIMGFSAAESIESINQARRQNTLTPVYDSNGFEGLINASGQIVFPYSQHMYQVETIQSNILRVMNWVDGTERCALYNSSKSIRTGFIYRNAYGGDTCDSLILVLSMGGLYGYVDNCFNEVIPCNFFDAQPFACGLAWIEETDKKKGFIDENGELAIQPTEEWSYAYHFSENMAIVFSSSSDLAGYIDRSGNVIIPIQYRDAYDFCEGKAVVADDKSYFFILKNANLLNNARWDYAESFSNGFAVVYENDQVGYINYAGELIIPCIYMNALTANDDQTGWVSTDGLTYCLIDLINKVIVSEPYMPVYEDNFFPHKMQYYAVRTKSGIGIIDNAGNIIVQPIWPYVYFDADGKITLEGKN